MSLLMIPGPIEVSPAVIEAGSGKPPGHLAADFIEAFGHSLEQMRVIWKASADSQPFLVAGSGTLAMEIAATNVVDPGEPVVVVQTGWFSDRMAEMARRRGARVTVVESPAGETPSLDDIAAAMTKTRAKVLFATHVDTSTGVRCDAAAYAALATEHGALSVFDGVCATAAERFDMESWGADIYLTGSQKAIGLPAGLALLVASPRALAKRSRLAVAPPMTMDFESWLPIMKSYEARGKGYFATPATSLVKALPVAFGELLSEDGIDGCFARHQRGADAFRAAWSAMGLSLVASRPELAANTLSAVRYPEGVGPSLVGRIAERGVVVAGGLHPDIKTEYFRVGHMGDVLRRPDALETTVRAIADALTAEGHATDADAAWKAFCDVFER